MKKDKKTNESLVGGALFGLAMKGVFNAAIKTRKDDPFKDKKAFIQKYGKHFVKGIVDPETYKLPKKKGVSEASLAVQKTILSWKEKQRVKKMKVKKGKLTNEQVMNELNKSTLASYIDKAAFKVRKHTNAAAHNERDALNLSTVVNRTTRDRRKTQTKDWIEGNKKAIDVLYANSIKHDKIARKREKGIRVAANKLAKEEYDVLMGEYETLRENGIVEEIEINEISKALAGNYLKKTAPGSEDSIKIGADILKAGERAKDQGSKLGGYDRKKAATALATDSAYASATTKWLNRRAGRARADARLHGEETIHEVSAPGQEDWIRANKDRFIKKYGEKRGKQILYAKAWKMTKEGKEFDYAAHMALKSGARTQPGHYLTKNGSTISGPHPSPAHAVRAYKDLHDTTGVKIVHMKESVFESKEKSKKVTDKAIAIARDKKKSKVNVEPELKVPDTSVRSPVLHGTEGEQTKDQS